MTQPVAIVTGASSGIGKETARTLLGQGWHVIATGRDPERSKAAEADLFASGKGRLDFLRGDMALMAETRRIADEIKALTNRIDLLFNNAGGVRDARYISAEGTEETFSANHLAPFLLTRELMPLLADTASRAAPGTVRVLATSSRAYLMPRTLNWDDIQHLNGDFAAGAVYCEVKLANMLFTAELARRVEPLGIAAHALVPGPVATNFFNHGDATMRAYAGQADALSPAEVAQTVVWMATAAETGLPGGRAFYEMAELPIEPHGRDPEAAARLWQVSEDILASLGI